VIVLPLRVNLAQRPWAQRHRDKAEITVDAAIVDGKLSKEDSYVPERNRGRELNKRAQGVSAELDSGPRPAVFVRLSCVRPHPTPTFAGPLCCGVNVLDAADRVVDDDADLG